MALEGAQQLLDFSHKLDINLLDNVIKTMYHGSGAQVCYFLKGGRGGGIGPGCGIKLAWFGGQTGVCDI